MARILVVEKDTPIRIFMIDALTDEGHHVWDTQDALTGILMAQQYVPDVIIFDILMNPIDGPQFAHQLLSDPKTSTIPLVLCTAMAVKSIPEPWRYTTILHKPFSLEQLFNAICHNNHPC